MHLYQTNTNLLITKNKITMAVTMDINYNDGEKTPAALPSRTIESLITDFSCKNNRLEQLLKDFEEIGHRVSDTKNRIEKGLEDKEGFPPGTSFNDGYLSNLDNQIKRMDRLTGELALLWEKLNPLL